MSTTTPLVPTSSARSPLLHAWHDPLANIKTHSRCVALADLNCDGDNKLCICDLDKKLKVYKGTSMVAEYAILDSPVAMCITYAEAVLPRIPSIAVAAGSHVFIYRQLRPYRKWSCPPVDIAQTELDIWNDLKNGNIAIPDASKMLSEARDSGTLLTSRSFELLSYETEAEKADFVADVKEAPMVQHTIVSCMDILKKDTDDTDGVSHLVVGTEAGQVYILPPDASNSTFLCKVQLPSTPVLLSVTGLFDVEWRVTIICRDGKMYNMKNGEARGTAVLSGTVVDLGGTQAIAVARQDKSLWIATMEKTVSCYSNRGKRLKGIVMTEDISDVCVMSLKRAKVNHLLLVALANGELCLYRDLTMIYSFKVDSPVHALCYGLYGREENSLIIVHGNNSSGGAMTIKMWRRTADIDNLNIVAGPPPEQDIPLPVPKKTKLYVEQTQREREKAPDIHRGFQRDLCKLRLTTARAYVKTLTDGYMGSSSMGSQDVRIQAQVMGLGPKFQLKITLQNASNHPIVQSRILFSFDTRLYSMGNETDAPNAGQSVPVPILLPGPKHVVDAQILSVDPQGRAGQILLLLYAANSPSCVPILSASVRMPASELLTF